MTTLQLSKRVNATARAATKHGQTIAINYSLPYIAINTEAKVSGLDEYFFQGEEADNLIEEARNSPLHNYCSIENIILWQSQSW